MRIWDVSAGYLNRQSLLGEHRELHGLHVILSEGRTGYARHPETRRWVGGLSGLAQRHALLAAEMRLRGYVDRSPIPPAHAGMTWPAIFVTDPFEQLRLLRRKYVGRDKGRIPLPRNAQELWAQHEYSVMARDPEAYRRLGRAVARLRTRDAVQELARDLTVMLREPPPPGRLVNALAHMWGHVRGQAGDDDVRAIQEGPAALLARTQALAVRHRERYLLSSTALSELALYVDAAASAV